MNIFEIVSKPRTPILNTCTTYGGPAVAAYIYDPHPAISTGISLDGQFTAKLGGKTITASEELLRRNDAYKCTETGITVLKASVELDGQQILLVPEKREDAGKAMVLLKLDRCDYPKLSFSNTENKVLAREVMDDGWLTKLVCAGGYTEHLLAQLEKEQDVLAIRSGKPGKQVEVIVIHFDGSAVRYSHYTYNL